MYGCKEKEKIKRKILDTAGVVRNDPLPNKRNGLLGVGEGYVCAEADHAKAGGGALACAEGGAGFARKKSAVLGLSASVRMP